MRERLDEEAEPLDIDLAEDASESCRLKEEEDACKLDRDDERETETITSEWDEIETER